MRTLVYGETTAKSGAGTSLNCRYEILIRTLPDPVLCESYGIRVTLSQTGEAEEIPDITVLPERIEALAELLLRGAVTPCTLRDVVADWL